MLLIHFTVFHLQVAIGSYALFLIWKSKIPMPMFFNMVQRELANGVTIDLVLLSFSQWQCFVANICSNCLFTFFVCENGTVSIFVVVHFDFCSYFREYYFWNCFDTKF